MTSAIDISNRIIEAVMAQKLAPGSRLGEQQLAMLFDCSRTIVREALTHLSVRGIVTVSSRRGWYVIEPSVAEARLREISPDELTPREALAALYELKGLLKQ